MRDEENAYQSWLWGEILLFGLLGATLALFVTYPNLRPTYDLPQVRLVLDTMVALAAVLVAVLAGVRFSVDGRRLDWLLCAGFSLVAGSTFCFGIAPILGGQPLHRTEQWSWIWGRVPAVADGDRSHPAAVAHGDARAPRAGEPRRRRRIRLALPCTRQRPRPLDRSRRNPVALRRPPLPVHAARLERVRLDRRLPPLALVRRAARRRLARDPVRRVRARGGGGTRARRPGDPRRPGAVPVRRLDARDDARERCRSDDNAAAAETSGRRRAAGSALRDPRALFRERDGPLRRRPAPLRRLPDCGRPARGRPRDRQGRPASAGRADRGLPHRPR